MFKRVVVGDCLACVVCLQTSPLPPVSTGVGVGGWRPDWDVIGRPAGGIDGHDSLSAAEGL